MAKRARMEKHGKTQDPWMEIMDGTTYGAYPLVN